MTLLAAASRVLAQAEDDVMTTTERSENLACAGDAEVATGSPVCRQIFQLTESRALAQNAGVLFDGAIRALILVILAYVVSRLLKRMIDRFVRQMNDRSIEKLEGMRRSGSVTDTAPISLARTQMRTETIGGVLRSGATVIVWTVAGLMILGAFGFDLGPLIAGAGIIGVALGFGAQSLVKDFLAGIFMLLEDQFGVGDIVDIGEAVGTVDAVTLRTTKIRSINGTLWHVPNGEITRVGNMSQLWSRALLDIGVAYETHVPDACKIMKRVADDLADEEEWSSFFFEPAEVWGVQDLGDNEVLLRMVAKVTPAKQWAIERELRARIKHAFDEAGISIPYPQRTVWIRQPEAPGSDGARPTGGGESAEEPGDDEGIPRAGGDDFEGGQARPEVSPWLGTHSGPGAPTV